MHSSRQCRRASSCLSAPRGTADTLLVTDPIDSKCCDVGRITCAQVFDQAIEEAVHHKTKTRDRLARGEFGDDEDDDLAFMAEVKDALEYFDEKEAQQS